MSRWTDHYARLGLPLDATPEEVRRAYRDAARRLHPDTRAENGVTELFLEVQEAYEILADPDRRSAYDNTLPPEFRQPAMSLATLYSRSCLPRITETQLIYTLIELSAPPGAKDIVGPPLNVCLILDCSISMQGPALDAVKNTAIELVRQLRAKDILSIVAFSDEAQVLLAAGSRFDLVKVETGIRMLQTGGGTEIYRGLESGYDQVRRYRDSNHVNHMILITDGRTYGDEPLCLRLAEQASHQGIGISSLGIGGKWNDTFLDSLTALTGGNSMYVSQPKEIRSFLREKFSGLGKSYGENMAYNFETGPGVHLRYAFRLQPEASPLEVESPMAIGSLPSDTQVSLLFEFMIEAMPSDTSYVSLASGRISVDVPSRTPTGYAVRLVLERPTTNDPDPEPPPHALVQAMSRLNLYRMQERARQEVSTGRVRDATRRLQNLATGLYAQGNPELAQAVLAEVNHLEHHHSYSEEGEKRIKYGTRGLVIPKDQSD